MGIFPVYYRYKRWISKKNLFQIKIDSLILLELLLGGIPASGGMIKAG